MTRSAGPRGLPDRETATRYTSRGPSLLETHRRLPPSGVQTGETLMADASAIVTGDPPPIGTTAMPD